MNNLSVNLVYLAFLSMPGIVGAIVYKQLVRPRAMKTWQELVEILLFSVAAYCVYSLICLAISSVSHMHLHVRVLDTLNTINISPATGKAPEPTLPSGPALPWNEIISCTAISFVLAYVAAFTQRKKYINRIGQWLGVSERYGDEDVWDYLFNVKELPKPLWLYVKDHKLNLLYFGIVKAFSDSGRDRELVLVDVDVHDITSGLKQFHRDIIYLSRERFELTIEIPTVNRSWTEGKAPNKEEITV